MARRKRGELQTAHIDAWRQATASAQRVMESLKAMHAHANTPSAIARMRRAYEDCIIGITSKRIRAGQPAPLFPSFDQAFGAGFSIDLVNEQRDDRNRVVHADTVVRLAEGSVVARLVARKHLSVAQGATAALYLSIWESAGMTMRVTGSYGEGTGGGQGASPMPQSQAMAIARSELRALRASIATELGPDGWRFLERIIIDDETVTAVGFAAYRRAGVKPTARTATRTGMRLLKGGLKKAAEYFHGLKRRRRRYASARPASSEERQAYFRKGADQTAVAETMRKNRDRNAKRAERKAARKDTR